MRLLLPKLEIWDSRAKNFENLKSVQICGRFLWKLEIPADFSRKLFKMAEKGSRRLSTEFYNFDSRNPRRISIAEAVAGAENPNVLARPTRQQRIRQRTAHVLKQQLRQSFFGRPGGALAPPGAIDLLPTLQPLDSVFITPAGATFPLQNLRARYELLNAKGMRLFFIAELLEEAGEPFTNHRELDILVLGTGKQGGFMCDISGSTRHALVQDPRLVTHGTVEAEGGRGFRGQTLDGRQFQILASSSAFLARNPDNFKINGPSGFKVGEIRGEWPGAELERLRGGYGMEFLPTLDSEEKLVLLAAFLVQFFLNKVETDPVQRKKDFWTGVAFAGVVAVLVIAMAATVIYFALQTPK